MPDEKDIQTRNLPKSDCERTKNQLRDAGYLIVDCEDDPDRPGWCILRFKPFEL